MALPLSLDEFMRGVAEANDTLRADNAALRERVAKLERVAKATNGFMGLVGWDGDVPGYPLDHETGYWLHKMRAELAALDDAKETNTDG